jgi:hypothetical protein
MIPLLPVKFWVNVQGMGNPVSWREARPFPMTYDLENYDIFDFHEAPTLSRKTQC